MKLKSGCVYVTQSAERERDVGQRVENIFEYLG